MHMVYADRSMPKTLLGRSWISFIIHMHNAGPEIKHSRGTHLVELVRVFDCEVGGALSLVIAIFELGVGFRILSVGYWVLDVGNGDRDRSSSRCRWRWKLAGEVRGEGS